MLLLRPPCFKAFVEIAARPSTVFGPVLHESPRGVPAEKHRLIGGGTTLQHLGGSSFPGRFSDEVPE